MEATYEFYRALCNETWIFGIAIFVVIGAAASGLMTWMNEISGREPEDRLKRIGLWVSVVACLFIALSGGPAAIRAEKARTELVAILRGFQEGDLFGNRAWAIRRLAELDADEFDPPEVEASDWDAPPF